MTKTFGGVILRPGKDSENDEDKESMLASLEKVKELMEGFTFDGYKWTSVIVPPGEEKEEVEIDGVKFKNDFFMDKEEVDEIYQGAVSKSKLKKLQEDKNLIWKEMKLMHKHLDQRQHSLIFRRCEPGTKMCSKCRKRWRSLPKEGRLPKVFRTSLPKKVDGGLFYVPRTDQLHPGKNLTYLDQVSETKTSVKILPDSDLNNPVVRCQVRNHSIK